MQLKLLLLLVGLLNQGIGVSSFDAVKVFYVKPTGPTGCPSGDSPCHSLQYYANYSSFNVNNSKFVFLEGEHLLDSVVYVRYVANLSLVGAGSGVKIICEQTPSGLHVRDFVHLSIENMLMFNCYGFKNTTVYFETGSNVNLNGVTISSEYQSSNSGTGLTARDVLESFSVFNSSFLSIDSRILMVYSLCSHRSRFRFVGNKLNTQLMLTVYCSDVSILIEDIFEKDVVTTSGELYINFGMLTGNSLLVDNIRWGGSIYITTALTMNSCNEEMRNSKDRFLKFTGVELHSELFLNIGPNCTILFEDSIFSSGQFVILGFGHIVQSPSDLHSVQATLINVTHIDSEDSLYFFYIAVLLVNCTFENTHGSAIQAKLSEVIFQGYHIFKNNSALIGGGMQLVRSLIHLQPRTYILFEGNHASYVGGAIYSDNYECAIHIDTPSLSEVSFINNTANLYGSSLYGAFDICCIDPTCEDFYDVFNISNTEADPSAIASVPDRVCLCDDGKYQPNCSNNVYSIRAFPGQDFPIRLAVVGAGFAGVVPGSVRAYFGDFSQSASLGPLQSSQASNRPYCMNFNYSIYTTKKNVSLILTSENDFFAAIAGDSSGVNVTVDLKSCPVGFALSPTTGKCVCEARIIKDIDCYINDQSFLRPANSWIGFYNGSPAAGLGVIFHPNCPIGHCLPFAVNVTRYTVDKQCDPHRTGLLCGTCEANYSRTLGNGKCAQCSNTYLLLLLPLSVSGLFLVAVLFALNLTVTEGSVNGLIFYANVIGMNYRVLFLEETSYLYTFLAWINLDLGINTCLFNGMDGFTETWLQFAYPLYLWAIILVIIQVYDKFPTLAGKFGGKNAVKVLATLLLLSYTKLQRTVVTILSFTMLEYPNGITRSVWLYDSNLEFFKGKHLYLGLAGLFILVFLIAPYTLCLASFQRLQACSGHKLFQCVNKLKPVFDSYAGPYKDKYRFWTGMLLVTRTLLIILFTINTTGSADVNLLIVLVVSFSLAVANSNGVYRNWAYNYLESFFYLQLGVFAGSVLYARHNHGSVTTVADTSIGITLVIVFAVVGYHILRRVMFLRKYYYGFKGYADITEDETPFTHSREKQLLSCD